MKAEEILLIYDKECPLCDNYCQLVRIRKNIGDLRIVNARENSEVMDDITAQRMDIDQGMVLKMGGQYYYGADAVHALALISTRSGVFNRFNYWLFKSETLSGFLYPWLRYFRNIFLKVLGKTKINNLGLSNNDKF